MSLRISKIYTKQGSGSSNKGDKIVNILFAISYTIICFSRLRQMYGVPLLALQVPLAIMGFFLVGHYGKRTIVHNRFSTILFFILACLVINMSVIGNADFKNILYAIIVAPSISILLYSFDIKKITVYSIFFIPAAYTLYYLLSGGNPDEMLFKSHNYISYYTVLNSLPYFVKCGKDNQTPSIIIPFLCLVISVLSIGRGGIIMSAILTAGVALMNWNRKGVSGYLYKGIIVIIIASIVYYGISPDFIDQYFNRFVEYGMDSTGRGQAYSEYAETLVNPINFIFGTPVSNLFFVSKFLNGSLHNSYLTMHARYGIFALFLFYAMIKGFVYLFKKRLFPICIVVLALLVKAFTDADTAGEATCGDIYVYVLLLYYLHSVYMPNKKI